MEYKRRLEVTVKSATDLKYGKIIGKRCYYVVVSVSDPGGNSSHDQTLFTPDQMDDGTGLRWDHDTLTFTVDEDATHAGNQKLKFVVKAKKTCGSDKEAGSVEVPVKTLLDQRQWAGAGDEKPLQTGYRLMLLSGKIKGYLQFSYKFGQRFSPLAAIGYPLLKTADAAPSIAAQLAPQQELQPDPQKELQQPAENSGRRLVRIAKKTVDVTASILNAAAAITDLVDG